MIKTILIDDNRIMREHFEKMVDWESAGFELLAVSGNGILGWEDFQKYRPQLVITDVRMPGLSGIELTKKIKTLAPDTLVVFISNYDDFNYVRAAMELEVYDYILKHEARGAKLFEKLKKIKNKIEAVNTDRHELFESKLYLALSNKNILDIEEFFPDKYTLALLDEKNILPPFEIFFDSGQNEYSETKLKNMCYSYNTEILAVTKLEKYQYALLFKTEHHSDITMNELMEGIKNKLHDSAFYITRLCINATITQCLYEYNSKKDGANLKYFYKHGTVLEPYLHNPPEDIANNECKNITEIIRAIKKEDKGVYLLFDRFCENVINSCDYKQLLLLSVNLLDFFLLQQQEMEEEFFTLEEDDKQFLSYAPEICFWLKNKVIAFRKLMKCNPIINYTLPVKKSIQYMNRNYAKADLSVSDIAEQVNMLPTHLNTLFKNETGLTVIKWLTKIRIDHAKKLLKNQQKITEIFEQVGYSNISYFSNVFKKVCGQTPVEYRRKYNEND